MFVCVLVDFLTFPPHHSHSICEHCELWSRKRCVRLVLLLSQLIQLSGRHSNAEICTVVWVIRALEIYMYIYSDDVWWWRYFSISLSLIRRIIQKRSNSTTETKKKLWLLCTFLLNAVCHYSPFFATSCVRLQIIHSTVNITRLQTISNLRIYSTYLMNVIFEMN